MGVYFDHVKFPRYCTNCGAELTVDYDNYTRQEWLGGLSHICKCGTHFIYMKHEDLPDEQRKELEYYQ